MASISGLGAERCAARSCPPIPREAEARKADEHPKASGVTISSDLHLGRRSARSRVGEARTTTVHLEKMEAGEGQVLLSDAPENVRFELVRRTLAVSQLRLPQYLDKRALRPLFSIDEKANRPQVIRLARPSCGSTDLLAPHVLRGSGLDWTVYPYSARCRGRGQRVQSELFRSGIFGTP